MKSSDDAPARAWQLEFLNSERESVIVWVKDQETVEDVLLDALGLVAGRNQRASGADDDVAFLNASRLGVLDTVRLDVVDDGAPLAVDVDGTERLDVAGRTRAKINFIEQFLDSVNRAARVDQRIFVEIDNSLVVLIKGLLDFYNRILGIFQTPRFSGIFGALWNGGVFISRWRAVRRRFVVGLWSAENSNDHGSDHLIISIQLVICYDYFIELCKLLAKLTIHLIDMMKLGMGR